MNPSFPRPAQLQNAMRAQQSALAYAHLRPHIQFPSYPVPGAPSPAGGNRSNTSIRAPPVSRGHSREDSRPSQRAVPYPFTKRAVAQETPSAIPPPSARAVPPSSRDEKPVPEERPRASLIGPIRTDPLNAIAKGQHKESKKAERMERCKMSLEACLLVESVGEASVKFKACRRDVALGAPYVVKAWTKHLREDAACIRKRVEMVEAGVLSLSVLELKHPWARRQVKQK